VCRLIDTVTCGNAITKQTKQTQQYWAQAGHLRGQQSIIADEVNTFTLQKEKIKSFIFVCATSA